MSSVIDCSGPDALAEGTRFAAAALRRGEIVVLPTDTVYGVAADAFSAPAVQLLLEAKGRGRDVPPPVLVPEPRTLDGLATDVPAYARRLVEEFWPGPLTVVLQAQPTLLWDLGETNGTVAIRMPDNEVALALLRETGPLAVTSANLHGQPAALSAADAKEQLGDDVAVYLDGGPARGGVASTIVDCTKERPIVLRRGAIDDADVFAAADLPEADPSAPASTEPDSPTEAPEPEPPAQATQPEPTAEAPQPEPPASSPPPTDPPSADSAPPTDEPDPAPASDATDPPQPPRP